MDYKVGDIVMLGKNHACGSNQWEIIRVGMDIKLRCNKCHHIIILGRANFNETLLGKLEENKTLSESDVAHNQLTHGKNWIRNVENPRMVDMKDSVNENGMTIRYIKNPSDEIIKMAIKQNPLCIQFINNVSDEQIKLALSYNVAAIQFIKEPRESIVEYAMKLNPYKMKRYQLNDDGYYKKKNHLLKNIDNINLLPENEIVSLLEKDGNLLKYIENPNSTMIITAVKKNPLSICWVHNPATEVMRIAVERDPNSMKKYVLDEESNVVLKSNDEKDSIFQIVMSSLNEQEKLFYFRKDASFMKNLEEVPFEMQIMAIKQNPLLYKNPLAILAVKHSIFFPK